jgi:PQQ-dependent dehydrogenase (methanol/ethanol family)
MRALSVRFLLATVVAAAASWSLAAQAPAPATVTAQDLRDGLKNPTRWPNYGGDYGNQRHSPLTQITPANVNRLTAQWQFQTDTLGKFEAAPLVLDGVIYITGPLDTGWAIDARTGRQIWRYRRDLPPGLIACCGLVNRGFGVLGDHLFKTTLDARIVSVSRKTGALEWDTPMANFRHGYSGTTAPLVVKDKVIAGVAGAEYGIRGFIDAYDAQTGKQVWRFYTTAGPDDPGHATWRGTDPKAWQYGGGSIWVPGAYDPETNLTYWGTGNAGPDYNGSAREGDNLYTASIVALDADTGALKWHYQFTPHDIWDYDSTQMPVLADLTIDGQLRKVVLFANRNGFFYVLDRATGKLLRATPFIQTTWAKAIRPDGRPMLEPNSVPSEEGTKVWDAASVQSVAQPALRHRARIVRRLLFVERGLRARRRLSRRRGAAPGRPAVQHAARDRRRYRRAEVGISLHQPVVGGRALDRVGAGVRRRLGQRDCVRCEKRQTAVALPDRFVALCRRDHLHGRRSTVRADAVGHDADGVCAGGVLVRVERAEIAELAEAAEITEN